MQQQGRNQVISSDRPHRNEMLSNALAESDYPVFNSQDNKRVVKVGQETSPFVERPQANMNWPVFSSNMPNRQCLGSPKQYPEPAYPPSTQYTMAQPYGHINHHFAMNNSNKSNKNPPLQPISNQHSNGFQPYRADNHQSASVSDPRVRFYNSVAENEVYPKPSKESYFTQSTGNAPQPTRRLDSKDQKQLTLASTQQESVNNYKGQVQNYSKSSAPYHHQVMPQGNSHHQRPTSGYATTQHLSQMTSVQKPQCPNPYFSHSGEFIYGAQQQTVQPQLPRTINHQHPQIPLANCQLTPFLLPISLDYQQPQQLSQQPIAYQPQQMPDEQPLAQMTYSLNNAIINGAEYMASPNSNVLQPTKPYPQYQHQYQHRPNRDTKISIIQKLSGESCISFDSRVDSSPTLEKIVEYIEILDQFLKNIGEFDRYSASTQENRSEGLVNFYLFKRCCLEKVRLERCLRGQFNLFEEVDFLDITDEELRAFRQDPENHDVFQLISDENRKLGKYLGEILGAFMSKFKIFPKANTNLDENFESELCYYLNKEVEYIEEALVDPEVSAQTKLQMRKRECFLYESLFLVEFFNGRFLKYYEDYKQQGDLRKYLKHHRKAYSKLIAKYIPKK